MDRHAALLLAAFFSVYQLSCGTEVTLTDQGSVCLYVSVKAHFSVSYQVADMKREVAEFELPEEVSTEWSSCEEHLSSLRLDFGEGHSLEVAFSANKNVYQSSPMTFIFNLRDQTLFRDSVSTETLTVKVDRPFPDVDLDSSYSCLSRERLLDSPAVNITLSHVLLQAFVTNNQRSQKITSCSADKTIMATNRHTTTPTTTTTTPTPTTTPTTTTPTTTTPTPTTTTTPTPTTTPTTTTPTTTTPTAPPKTTTTPTTPPKTTPTAPPKTTPTAPPKTTTTPTAPPTTTPTAPPNTTTTPTTPPTPTPSLPTPSTGKFFVQPVNGSVCLMANLGLRVGYQDGNKYEEKNFESDKANFSGSCGVDKSELLLESDSLTFTFTFVNDSKKFHLQSLNVTGKTSSGQSFGVSNSSLTLWEASVGSSYMCNKEQNFSISSSITFNLFTFNLQVQPFGVKKAAFSTADQCFLDSDLSFLVPIAVGVALSFLIVLVLISYLIGRRKSRTGYQSV